MTIFWQLAWIRNEAQGRGPEETHGAELHLWRQNCVLVNEIPISNAWWSADPCLSRFLNCIRLCGLRSFYCRLLTLPPKMKRVGLLISNLESISFKKYKFRVTTCSVCTIVSPGMMCLKFCFFSSSSPFFFIFLK